VAKKITFKQIRTLSDLAMAMAEFAANTLIAAEQLGIKTQPIEHFPLDEIDRGFVAVLPSLDSKLRKRLVQNRLSFTVAETSVILLAIAESLLDADEKDFLPLMLASKKK
jgi:hypothetical protein